MHSLHDGLEPGLVTSINDTFTSIGEPAKLNAKHSAAMSLKDTNSNFRNFTDIKICADVGHDDESSVPVLPHSSTEATGKPAKAKFKQHPLSAAFPAMQEDEYVSLCDSIQEIGVQNPITLFEGMVIDGWHRYLAATDAGMACPVVALGDVDPKDFVMAQNKARRHITAAQMAMATTAVYAWKPAGNPQLPNRHIDVPIEKTNAELAQIAGVHLNTIKQSKSVQHHAAPEVLEAVKRGEVGLPKAAAIAKLPLDKQAAALHQPMPIPVKVAMPAAEPEPQDDGPSAEELAANAASVAADRELMHTLLNTDAPLAALAAENKRLNAEVAQLKQRIHGLMDEKNVAISQVKLRDRQIAKLKKLLQVPA